MNPAYAAFLVACADASLATWPEPETPRPLPDERDDLCRSECYMFGATGCAGACRMLARHEQRLRIEADHPAALAAQARLAAYEAERAARKAQAEAEAEARAEAERIANTPAKTLRRRALIAGRSRR